MKFSDGDELWLVDGNVLGKSLTDGDSLILGKALGEMLLEGTLDGLGVTLQQDGPWAAWQ